MKIFHPSKTLHKVELSQLSLSFPPNPYLLKHFEPNLQWVQNFHQIRSKFLALTLITLVPIAITIFREITVPVKPDPIITPLIFSFFFWPMRENHFFKLFFPCIYSCSFERKLHVIFWKAFNCCFSSMSYVIISNILPYFQWNFFFVAFSRLFLYCLLFNLDLCFTCDIWCRLNNIRSLWPIILDAWFYFGIIAFGKIWLQISFWSHDVKRAHTQNKNFKSLRLNTQACRKITTE